MSDEKIYAEGFVTFYYADGRWKASVFDSSPTYGDAFRIRIPVPEELVKPLIEAEVEADD